MKTKSLFCFFYCLLFINYSPLFAQSGWFVQQSGTSRNLNDLFFINSNTGWLVGDSIILKTTNGGTNWILQYAPASAKILSVHFINELTGFATGYKEIPLILSTVYVFKTTNGGINWITVSYENSSFYGCAFSSDIFATNEYVVYKTFADYQGGWTNFGRIDKTTNGGSNFVPVLLTYTATGLSFIDAQTGWTTSYYAMDVPPSVFKIFKTTNGGLNWSIMFKDSLSTLLFGVRGEQIQFINVNSGYVLAFWTGTTKFMKTTNGGLNWETAIYNHYKNRAMYFVDLNTGWIGGGYYLGNSNISRTTNGGLNWTDQNVGGTQYIQNIFFVNSMIGWAVGYAGVILKTINGGVLGISKISNSVPDKFYLFQNYPNPFNPNTIIKFQIKDSRLVTLKGFDVLGKEIVTLVNEKLSPGIYEVSFDGSNLPSGIYFYTIRSGDPEASSGQVFTDTKRMLLVK